MLEASFPKPLLDGKRKPETANHPGLQSVVAADADGAVVAVVVANRCFLCLMTGHCHELLLMVACNHHRSRLPKVLYLVLDALASPC